MAVHAWIACADRGCCEYRCQCADRHVTDGLRDPPSTNMTTHSRSVLCEQSADDFAMHVGQAEVTTGVAISETLVV